MGMEFLLVSGLSPLNEWYTCFLVTNPKYVEDVP